MPINVVPLSEEHLEQATVLAAARYRAARQQVPFLPVRFEEPDAILPRLRGHVGHVPGVAALCGTKLVGYLATLLVMNNGERLAYVPDFGHAAVPGDGYQIYRRLYAHIADHWLAHGCFLHGITLYPHERQALDAWVSVGFGLVVVDALRELDVARELTSAPRPARAVEIRRLGAKDSDLLTPLWLALGRHLSSAPIYLPLIVEDGKRDQERWIADEAHALWMAFADGQPVAYLRFEPSKGLVLPTTSAGTVAITGALTREDVRGQGIGTALLEAGFEWARSQGYTHCSVDFESANIPGSRFWLRHFEPVCHSLMRRVDQRLAWANARRDQTDLLRAYEGRTWVG